MTRNPYAEHMAKDGAKDKTIIGWSEWVQLPGLGLPLVKAKIDTGARTSALHAFNIKPFTRRGMPWVKFDIHPLQGNADITVTCKAPITDQRLVTDSGGKSERRFVIAAEAIVDGQKQLIEITLTNREKMAYRMLLGRQGIGKFGLLVNPAHPTMLFKVKPSLARKIYEEYSKGTISTTFIPVKKDKK